jgi:hypothetical protein
MTRSLPESSRMHVDAIYGLAEFLMEVCPDHFSPELHRRFDALLRSSQSVSNQDGATKAASKADEVDLHRDGYGRNYITALCALLLAFLHQISAAQAKGDATAVKTALSDVKKQMSCLYEQFFGVRITSMSS